MMGLAFLDSAYWSHLWRQRLTRMLLLSLALHGAVAVLVQPRSYPASPYTNVVIEARLMPDGRVVPPPPPSPIPLDLQRQVSSSPESPPQPKPFSELVVPKTPVPAREPPPAGSVAVPVTPVTRPASAASAVLPSVPVMVDSTWYEARQLDVQPRAAQPIIPVYPPEAIRRHQHGAVKLMLKIDEFGNVEEAEVVEADLAGVFDDSALTAFRRARFVPAQKDGRPVRSLIYLRVHYELDGP